MPRAGSYSELHLRDDFVFIGTYTISGDFIISVQPQLMYRAKGNENGHQNKSACMIARKARSMFTYRKMTDFWQNDHCQAAAVPS